MKLRDTLLTERYGKDPEDEEKRKASLDAAAYAFKMNLVANEIRDLRKKHKAIGGKQFKQAEDMARKLAKYLEDAADHI